MKITTQSQAIDLVKNGKIQISCRSKVEADKVCALFPKANNNYNNVASYFSAIADRIDFGAPLSERPTLSAKRFLALEREEKAKCTIVIVENQSELDEVIKDFSNKNLWQPFSFMKATYPREQIGIYIENESYCGLKYFKTFADFEGKCKFITYAEWKSTQPISATKKVLDGGWCVKNDGSEEFKKVMRFTLKNDWVFNRNCFYGKSTINEPTWSNSEGTFNSNILTLPELKELIRYRDEPTPEQREIIGYYPPMSLFMGKIDKQDVFKDDGEGFFKCNKSDEVYFMPAEIVTTWTPKYAETEAELITELINDFINSDGQSLETFSKSQNKFTIKRK